MGDFICLHEVVNEFCMTCAPRGYGEADAKYKTHEVDLRNSGGYMSAKDVLNECKR